MWPTGTTHWRSIAEAVILGFSMILLLYTAIAGV
jgi:hypothetical protein